MTRIETLRQTIQKANKAYWIDSDPIISDQEYDRLIEQLKKLAPNDPILTEVHGSETTDPSKVRHTERLLSLDKSYSWDGILKWATDVARNEQEIFMVSPKYDGLCGEIQGDMLITRGANGNAGTDITGLTRNMGHITRFELENGKYTPDLYGAAEMIRHNDPDSRYVGEIVVPYWRFKKLKETYPDVFGRYKTPRNLSSAFCNSGPDSLLNTIETETGHPVYIVDFVSHTSYEVATTLKDLKNPKIREQLENELRDFYGYPTDGIVLRLKDEEYSKSLGATEHHPRGALALKWTTESKPVKITSIDWQVGEEHVTPVANFDGIVLDGVVVKRATLHCADFVERNQAAVGSTIYVERRGGVIPKVIQVINEGIEPNVAIPAVCPVCGHDLVRTGKFLSCKNQVCKGKIVNKIVRGLEIFGLKGVGPTLAERVVTDFMIPNIMAWVEDVIDVETLKAKGYTATQIITLGRIKDIMKNGVTWSTLLQSVCIPKVGKQFVDSVEKHYGPIYRLVNTPAVDDMYTLLVDLPGINLDALTNFMIWMEEYREVFLHYAGMFNIKEAAPPKEGSKKVCFTGTGPLPRAELFSLAEKHGFEPVDAIAQADLLVCSDPSGNSSKLKKARTRGIPIKTYETFLSEDLK